MFSGQKIAPNPAKTFFLENRCFRAKNAPNPAKTFLFYFYFFFWRTLVFGIKRLFFAVDLCFAFPILALSVLPSLSKNSSRTTVKETKFMQFVV